MERIAQFSNTDVNNAVVDFVPARVSAVGTTAVARRIDVITHASEAVKLFAAEMKGKVGAAARSGLMERGFNQIAVSARNGNYKPLAEALALVRGENVFITTRASFESLGDRFEAAMEQMESAGKKYAKGGEKLASKYLIETQCMSLIAGVNQAILAINAHKDEE